MPSLNAVGLETRFGFRTIELHQGDLAGSEYRADVLVISAFAGEYSPVAGTLIGALQQRLGIRVGDLARDPLYDLRDPFGIWISREQTGLPYRYIVCAELVGGLHPIEEAVDNVFVGLSILDSKQARIESAALPLLGGGLQMLGADQVLPPLLEGARRTLERSSCLNRILFVESNAGRAAALGAAMNVILGRVHVALPKTELIASLRKDLLTVLGRVRLRFTPSHQQLAADLTRIIEMEGVQSFEIGLLGRRTAEFVVDHLLGKSKTSPDLIKKIDSLGELRIAPWIRGYLHTLRLLGNEAAHEKPTDGRIPQTIREDDLAVGLFCIQRVLTFLEDFHASPKP